MAFFVFVLLCVAVAEVKSAILNPWSKVEAVQCGVEASTNLVHHNPWLVYIEYWRGDTDTEIRCAGTLIDNKHIVTAAHCVKTLKFSRLVARLGEYDVYSKEDCVQGVYFIRPICLPSGDLEKDTQFFAAGWGEIPTKGFFSHVKKIIPLPYWTREECQRVYQYNHIPENVICAGGEEGIDTCRGDSGGPLTRVRDTIELWGVTSHGNIHCGTKNSPGIYTSVADHLDWIKTVLDS
ncbi:hypothetical protein HF086_011947 [Spodoptera exigua]|uniref:Peptidase S1 domain-containing protein n=1 Tax=Spodoptera exigua TaxID=7107 RepID=A0A922M6R9_SPOEX|nr:hypothetical protein HF086_011947 [Spodoptera exigua]